MPLRIRRGSNAERLEKTFAMGELVYVTDEQKLVVGDGTTQGGIVVSTDVDVQAVQNTTANMFTEGQHTNIGFAYDAQAGTINATVDLSELDLVDIEGIIRADGFQGSIFLDDSTLFFDAGLGIVFFDNVDVEGVIRADGFQGSLLLNDSTVFVDTDFNLVLFENITAVGDLIPDQDVTFNIGNPDFRYATIHTAELQLDDNSITTDNGVVLVDGNEILLAGEEEYTFDQINVNAILLAGAIEQSIRPDGGTVFRNTLYDWNIEATWPIHQFQGSLLVDSPYRTQSDPGELASAVVIANTFRGDFDSKTSLQLGDQVGGFVTQAFINIGGQEDDIFTSAIITQIENSSTTGNDYPTRINFLTSDHQGNFSGASLSSRGVFDSPVLKTGTYADNAARDEQVGDPEQGMIVFNQAAGKFQGYDGTAWVDIS